MKKLRLWRQKIPDRLVIRMLAVLCVLLLGVSGLLLWQRNTAREGEKLRGDLLFANFRNEILDAAGNTYSLAVRGGPYSYSDCIQRVWDLSGTASRLGEAGVLSWEEAKRYHRFFYDLHWRLLEGDGEDLAAEEMLRLLVIVQEEPEFWEKGAPFEEFIALLGEDG